ncbi:MAG: Rieske (2Fe-2S) protein [Rhodospirillales bacterium]
MLKLCALKDIPDGKAKGFCVEGPKLAQRLFVIRRGARAIGYVDVCPHNLSRLDPLDNAFLTDDGEHICCYIHYALFEIDTGKCIDGPCFGDCLTPCPIKVEGGDIYLERDNVKVVDELSRWMSDMEPRA